MALARALAPAPELMLLDEAFSALDTSLRAQVRDETLSLLRDAGTPTLLVTHDAEEAIRVGDRIHAMLAGRIVQSGTPAELYAAPDQSVRGRLFRTGEPLQGPGGRRHGRHAARSRAGRGLAEGAAVQAIVRPEALQVRRAGRRRPARPGAGRARPRSGPPAAPRPRRRQQHQGAAGRADRCRGRRGGRDRAGPDATFSSTRPAIERASVAPRAGFLRQACAPLGAAAAWRPGPLGVADEHRYLAGRPDPCSSC